MITKGTGNLKKFLLRWVFELWIYILNLISFAFILYYFYMCGSGSVFRIRIRIQEAPEYGSNTDPDPQHCYLPWDFFLHYAQWSCSASRSLWEMLDSNPGPLPQKSGALPMSHHISYSEPPHLHIARDITLKF